MKLRAARKEPLSQIYVGNIEISEEDNEDTIINNIRSYCNNEHVRIVHAKVMYNRYNDYVVSCKIAVNAQAKERILSQGFWPSDVKCREWKKGIAHQPTATRSVVYDNLTDTLIRTVQNEGTDCVVNIQSDQE